MNETITQQKEIESLIGFKLNKESVSRINELKIKAEIPDFIDLFCFCLGTLEIFLTERIKDRVFVTLHGDYISDLDNWDKKVWMFEIEFLSKQIEVHAKHLEVLIKSHDGEPGYNLEIIRDLLGKDNYEDLIINSIVLVEWVLLEIIEGRIIGSVLKDEIENMDSKNWRIFILFTTKSDLADYKYSWVD